MKRPAAPPTLFLQRNTCTKAPPNPSCGLRADRGARRPASAAKTAQPAPQRGPGHVPHAPVEAHAQAPKLLPHEARLLETATAERACGRPGPPGPARPRRRFGAAAPGTGPRRSPGCDRKAPRSDPKRVSARHAGERRRATSPKQLVHRPKAGHRPGMQLLQLKEFVCGQPRQATHEHQRRLGQPSHPSSYSSAPEGDA